MAALLDLLDKCKTARSLNSDAELAAKLGVTKQSLSQWRKGGVITEKHLTALIDLGHADPVIAVQVMREQATTSAEKHVWGALARQLGVAATLAAVTLLAIPSGVYAATMPIMSNALARLFLVRKHRTDRPIQAT